MNYIIIYIKLEKLGLKKTVIFLLLPMCNTYRTIGGGGGVTLNQSASAQRTKVFVEAHLDPIEWHGD